MFYFWENFHQFFNQFSRKNSRLNRIQSFWLHIITHLMKENKRFFFYFCNILLNDSDLLSTFRDRFYSLFFEIDYYHFWIFFDFHPKNRIFDQSINDKFVKNRLNCNWLKIINFDIDCSWWNWLFDTLHTVGSFFEDPSAPSNGQRTLKFPIAAILLTLLHLVEFHQSRKTLLFRSTLYRKHRIQYFNHFPILSRASKYS